jgi:hypothetical protein
LFAPDAGEGGLDILLETGDQLAVGGLDLRETRRRIIPFTLYLPFLNCPSKNSATFSTICS